MARLDVTADLDDDERATCIDAWSRAVDPPHIATIDLYLPRFGTSGYLLDEWAPEEGFGDA